jgi:hypothetical protein
MAQKSSQRFKGRKQPPKGCRLNRGRNALRRQSERDGVSDESLTGRNKQDLHRTFHMPEDYNAPTLPSTMTDNAKKRPCVFPKDVGFLDAAMCSSSSRNSARIL